MNPNIVNKSQFLKTPIPTIPNSRYTWISTDSEENYKSIKNNSYGPDDIEYKYNNYGFRCDNFDSWEKYPIRILFTGCSLTEGIGLPLEDTWAKIMHSKICNERNLDIPYWNIAKAGSGIDHMTRYLYHYMDMLRPQYVISWLPFFERRERKDDDFYQPGYSNHKDSIILSDNEFIAYQTEKNLAMIQLLMEKFNSRFLYMSPNRTILNYGLDRITVLDGMLKESQITVDKARDGMHPGPNMNKQLAENFFNFFYPILTEEV